MNTSQYINEKLLAGLTTFERLGEQSEIVITNKLVERTYTGNIKKQSEESKDKPA